MNHNRKTLLNITHNYNIHIFSAKGFGLDENETTLYLITAGIKNYYRCYRVDSLDKYIEHELLYFGEKYKARADTLSEIKNYLLELSEDTTDENLIAIRNCLKGLK